MKAILTVVSREKWDYPVDKFLSQIGRAGSPLPAANVVNQAFFRHSSDGAHGVTRPTRFVCQPDNPRVKRKKTGLKSEPLRIIVRRRGAPPAVRADRRREFSFAGPGCRSRGG